LRSTTPPEELACYASSLSGFSEQAIENVCCVLERSILAPYAPKFPPLGEMLALCRAEEVELRSAKDNEWTLASYREAWYFDKFLKEQLEEGKTREEVMRKFPDMGPKWARWRNQTDDGTIRIPTRWCENCEGTGWIPTKLPSGNSAMRFCGCRTRTA
jgi:hypothetical protein